MNKRRTSIDGFVPRRYGGEVKGTPELERAEASGQPVRRLSAAVDPNAQQIGVDKPRPIGRSDIDESLRDIDSGPAKKQSRRQRKRLEKMAKKPRSRARRITKWVAITVLVAVLSLGGFLAFKFIIAGNNIFQGSIFDLFQSQPLKQDSNGRSNFLILGTTEDDPGHPGSNLTDSMMVVSIDQKNDNMYMFNIPRDLYVDYGMACASGYQGKINVYFSCSDSGTSKEAEQNRLAKTQKFIGNILGLDIQYGVHMDLSVVKQSVDAVGGIDVDVEGSNGAPGVLDRNFDWRCNFQCYYVKYTNGVHHLDGTHAEFLAMARGDVAPTYGLSNSNFDREVNQQKILIALKNKAMTTGILTNLDTVTKLLDSFGNNLRTNIQTSEIRTLLKVAGDIKSSDIHTLSLFNSGNGVVTSGPYNGESVVMPTSGMFNYSGIQSYIKKSISNDPVIQESAPIVVLNGTSTAGYGQTKADWLSKQGYNVTLVDNAPDGNYGKVQVYQIGTGDAATAKRLSSLFGVTIKKTTPPVAVASNVRFVVILGAVF